MQINFTQGGSIRSIDMEPIGDARKEVEKAAQRKFNRKTSKVRATLIAADLATLNESHPHANTYEELAKNIDVNRRTFTADDGFEYVRINIVDNN